MGGVIDEINNPHSFFFVFLKFIQVGKVSAVHGGKGQRFVLLFKNLIKQKGEGGGCINM